MEANINSIAFNDAHDYFVCCLSNGLRVYSADPLVEKVCLDSTAVGDVALACLLDKSNIVAIVPNRNGAKASGTEGRHQGLRLPISYNYNNNTQLLLWDDARKKFVLEMTFDTAIVAVKMSLHKLVVVLAKHIFVFTFPGRLTKLGFFETKPNYKGLCALSNNPGHEILVFPAHKIGGVHTMDLKLLNQSSSVSPVTISAHQNELACIAMNDQGSLLATASTKGTLIRLFDLHKKQLIMELRRGTDPANVYCIKFNADSSYLCASSDKGTIHIFSIKDLSLNKRSAFQSIGVLGSYVESQWALAKCAGLAECPCVCGFGPSNQSIIAVYMDGTYHKFLFSKDGTCNREAFERFLSITEDTEFWNSYK